MNANSNVRRPSLAQDGVDGDLGSSIYLTYQRPPQVFIDHA
ncbi:hypothetical protein EV561_104410 [Rhizobium sp. BK376]|jgi:hypothetical protein|nr:hypothetical protein EV561_104410 [Rhizobium sp. BK376]